MVKLHHPSLFTVILILVFFTIAPTPMACALFPQTAEDLERAEDLLKSHLEADPSLRSRILPTLWVSSEHYWLESRADFSEEALAMGKRLFSGLGDIISCVECNTWRLKVEKEGRVRIHNGELSRAELVRLKEDPRYGRAKSLMQLRETASGVEVRVIELIDGRILIAEIADATKNLSQIIPMGVYGKERDRRLQGEGLNYVFFNLGLYPKPQIQLEFLEQWGDRNQHLSGVGLSLVGPVLALGGIYHYMVPQLLRLNISGALYLPLANALQNLDDRPDAASGLIFQATAQYAIGESYGVFASVSSEPIFSVGFVFYGPILLPFLL